MHFTYTSNISVLDFFAGDCSTLSVEDRFLDISAGTTKVLKSTSLLAPSSTIEPANRAKHFKNKY